MSGYPNGWEVRTRNRQYSNQPGGLAQPEQPMVRDFTPNHPQSDHMRGMADALRAPEPMEPSMDYDDSNQPGEES
jgi:hypothetical protein